MRNCLTTAFTAVLFLLLAARLPAAAEDGTAPERTEVLISVTDTVVAHTAMDNPVRFTLVPESAAESARVTVSYRAISSLSDEGVEVDTPRDIGKYLVYIGVEFDDPGFYCAGKYLIYEIAEKKGAPLASEDAIRSVPKEFKASVESKNVTYSVGYEPPSCDLNIAGVEYCVKYSHLYANGSLGEYTSELPTEPGDYLTACFVLDTVVGSGRLIIDKLAPKIEMNDEIYTYTPEGIYPKEASVTPAGIELEYKAYIYENGAVGESVSFPLKSCGTYLISVCPSDTAHYVFTPTYCYVTINKVTPVITAESLVYTEDGKPKPLSFTVSPGFVEYKVGYYKLEDGGAVPLDGPPLEAGEYYAVVSVKSSSALNPATRVFGIRIVKAEKGAEYIFFILLKAICAAAALAAFALGGVQIYKARRRKGVSE